MKNKMDFSVIVGLLIVLMGFMFSMNVRIDSVSDRLDNMATKADLARVEADVREIRSLIVSHIERHNQTEAKRKISSKSVKKSDKLLSSHK